jgi:hypothetical protein
MPGTSENLWPTQFVEVAVPTPIAILRQQGTALGEMTKNIVLGRAHTEGGSEPGGFRQVFELYCPPLGYAVPLLFVEHGIDLYPVTIRVVQEADVPPLTAGNPESFRQRLKEVFARDKTQRMIASLLAQARE